MGSAATIVVTVEGQNGDMHVLKIAPALWERDSSGVMQKLYEAIDGIAGLPLRYDGRRWRPAPPADGETDAHPEI